MASPVSRSNLRTKLIIAERLIAEAEAAIAIRNNELVQSSEPWADAEREGMEDVLYALKVLRTAQNFSYAA